MSRAQIDSERVKVLKKAIRDEASDTSSSGKYSYTSFCEQHGLFKKGKEQKAGGIWIACPFHNDEAPSLSYNEEKGIWHCFGCGAGGNYTDFIYLYETEVLGREISRNHFLNNLLQNDPIMQARVGFNSLFRKKDDTFQKVETRTFRQEARRIASYSELQEVIMRKGADIKKIKTMILMMQQGVPIEIAEREIWAEKKKEYDLAALEED